MNFFMGCLVLVSTAVLFFQYRPRSVQSREICLLSWIVGLISLVLSDGVLILQLVQSMMQLGILSCCFIRLRGERKYLERRKQQLRRLRLANHSRRGEAGREIPGKACA